MAPKKGNRERAAKAFKAMKPFGISTETIKSALKRLLDAYDNNWTYIEDDSYRVLIEAIFEPQDIKIMNPTVKQDFKLRDEPEEESELLEKKSQTSVSSPSGTCSHYVTEMQQTVETYSGTMEDIILEDHEKGKKPMPQFEIPLSVIHPEASPSCDDDSWSKSVVEGKELLALEYKNSDENENDDVAPPLLSEIEIASSCNGEVKMVFCISKPPEGFCVPSVDAVMKQVEERYSERLKGLETEFSLSRVLKDICESLKEEGSKMNM